MRFMLISPSRPMLLQDCALGNPDSPLRFDLARGETLALLGIGPSAVLRALVQPLKTSLGLTVSVVNGAEPIAGDLTVAQNLALGLPHPDPKGSDGGGPDARAIVVHWLHMLGLSGVSTLASGSLGIEAQRRIALARGLVGGPDVMVLDDPFRGCDPDERRRLGEALRLLQLHNRMGIILATRYPADARGIADRVMVLRDGRLVQQGDIIVVYERPASFFAARALGEVNFLPGFLHAVEDDVAQVTLAGGAPSDTIQLETMAGDAQIGQPCFIAIRPERVALADVAPEEMGQGAVPARVESRAHHGDHIRIGLAVGQARIVVRRPPGPMPKLGAQVAIAWQAPHAYAVAPDAGS
jgi:ABC-type Fe3+/spermidine/putrescine transport system ATPase subunit